MILSTISNTPKTPQRKPHPLKKKAKLSTYIVVKFVALTLHETKLGLNINRENNFLFLGSG